MSFTPKRLLGGGIAGLSIFAGIKGTSSLTRNSAESQTIKSLYPQTSGIAGKGRTGRGGSGMVSPLNGTKFNFRRR